MQKFQLDLTFFGLTLNSAPHQRIALFSQIHEIVFHGKGGYDWETIYNMPIWLRKFTFNKIKSYYDGVDKSQKKANSKGTDIDLNSSKTPNIPPQAFKPPSAPTYVTKKSKK